jgi:hypothetical protein
MLIIITYFLFLIPIDVACQDAWIHSINIFTVNTYLPYLFMLEILLNLNSAFYDRGLPVVDRKRIALNYVKNSLVADILSLVSVILFIVP